MEKVDVLNAYDQKLIESLPLVEESEALEILERSHKLFTNRKGWLKTPDRIAILEKTILLIKERREELALTAAREGGKPLADSLVEIDRAVEGIKVAIKELGHLHGTEIPMGLSLIHI